MTKEEFKEKLKADGLELSDLQMSQLETYKNMLLDWNEKMNLTAITKEEEIWEKHFYDSIYPFLKEDFKSLADIGSGAGFPGIPVQIAWPEKKITLVEPLQKRCKFLNAVKDELKLDNLQIKNERAEDFAKWHREKFDAVSARAVARLSILMELCVPLLKTGGTFIALKGRNGMEELAAAAPALDKLFMSLDHKEDFLLDNEAERINFYFKKNKKTPASYPRAYGVIKKKPLEVQEA